jgi:NADH-quinone oxidoreductase subunit N
VALNAVIGLAYYVRVAATLFGSPASSSSTRVSWAVGTAVGVATLVAVGIGFAPQLVMSLAGADHP